MFRQVNHLAKVTPLLNLNAELFRFKTGHFPFIFSARLIFFSLWRESFTLCCKEGLMGRMDEGGHSLCQHEMEMLLKV